MRFFALAFRFKAGRKSFGLPTQMGGRLLSEVTAVNIPIVRDRWQVESAVRRDYPWLCAADVTKLTDAICAAEVRNWWNWFCQPLFRPAPNPLLRLLANV